MSEYIDHEGTDQVVCPHCGHADVDSSELLIGGNVSGDDQCVKCEKWFHWDADFSVTYTTKAKES